MIIRLHSTSFLRRNIERVEEGGVRENAINFGLSIDRVIACEETSDKTLLACSSRT